MSETEDWITTEEAASLSSYHVDYIRKLLYNHKIQGRKFGPVWQVSRDSLTRYIQEMETKGERRGPKTQQGN